MQSLMLIKPTLIHKKEILNYQQTYKNAGLTLHGANQLAHFSADTFEDWLAYLSAPPGTNHFGYDKVADSTYLAWHTIENRMVGIIHLRHTLNDYLLQYAGNIGYSVHPQEWGKGYATQMLTLALEKTDLLGIKEVMLSCDKDNIASSKVILKNGGYLESEFERQGKIIQRYWIKRHIP
ncbi:GNAT family N-acetyltransferase [Pasteurella multocida]|uniref:GNAT family N-acetyltransferase n=1 Tax=Pasteurella multocida TaxID=747 RepID=UPI0020234B6D|nr:GNAT family N-acetyltransferase [Pasteurella multocida]URH77247.1 GNAT family N-acetyltransferase [Pasteurella multocida]URH81493.1 GNAT family N-acetyltransferase [Pasteurella multocida]HDR0996831.1 GNAT family N-acetyltransferase [Pasteurella multocida]HDR1004595.1 GNAT family N-acetyltransferase [Pasteurella multocida]HDR1008935.1 GNAT family N-acetyltransferase [Pasteurella multocida]